MLIYFQYHFKSFVISFILTIFSFQKWYYHKIFINFSIFFKIFIKISLFFVLLHDFFIYFYSTFKISSLKNCNVILFLWIFNSYAIFILWVVFFHIFFTATLRHIFQVYNELTCYYHFLLILGPEIPWRKFQV